MSPPRRTRHPWSFRSRSAAILDAVRRTQRHRRRHRHRHRLRKLHTAAASTSGANASSAQTNGISQGTDNMRQEDIFEKLPEDIIRHIHYLLPIQGAACAACVSRAFLRSWRCYSKLILNDHAVGLAHIEFEERKIPLIDKVDKILKNHYHNGVEVESLNLILTFCSNIKVSYLDRWLRRTVKSGFKELYLGLPIEMKIYNFPCSVLSDEGAASSIQSLRLAGNCAFHPTSTLGYLRRLKILRLSFVYITEEGLEHLFSKSSTLEEMSIFQCSGIICLKIPSTLEQLKFLSVDRSKMLRVVEINAPNLCSFHYNNSHFPYDSALPEIYVRNCSQLKHVKLSSSYPSLLSYARTSLPSIAGNVESLILGSWGENANTPVLQSKLPHLKNLEIGLRSATCLSLSYDIFSLVSFLDASPALESFILRVDQPDWAHYPVAGDDEECPRRKVDLRHNRLREVTITGFCSAKSLVELTIHIIESTHSLERLTLDTTRGYDRRIYGTTGKCMATRKIGKCWPMSKKAVEEAHRAVKTAGRYITGRVPLGVQFEVLGPCSRCHPSEQYIDQ